MVYLDVGPGAIEVWVECDGKRLVEYELKDKNGAQHQECYIASEEDKEFRIFARPVGMPRKQHSVDVHVDGVWVGGKAMRVSCTQTCEFEGRYVSPNEIRSFVFGKLKLQEDDGSLTDAKTLNNLATIRVDYRAISSVRSSTFAPHTTRLPGDSLISEKAKKASVHATRLGAKSLRDAQWGTSLLLRGFVPHDVTFHYAPIDVLYAREIIPRPPSLPQVKPSPPTIDGSRTASPPSPMQGPPAIGPSSSQIKKENILAVKQENVAGKKRTLDQAGIIDLTSDDENDDGDGGLSVLSPDERAAFARIKSKLAQARARVNVKHEKKPKRESGTSFTPGEVIVVSD